jgi:AcrR family transcriptional regulator
MPEDSHSRGEHTRLQIVQAAHDLFSSQGYHGTSMRQIASKAGLALSGLYNHFPSKEDVFQAVFLEFHPYLEIIPVLLDARGETVEQVVRDSANRLVRTLENRPDFLNLMFIELVEFRSAHTAELFARIFPSGMQIAQNIIRLGADRLRSIPPEILIRTFLGLFFSYYLTDAILGNIAPPQFHESAMDYFVELYLHGILIAERSEEHLR